MTQQGHVHNPHPPPPTCPRLPQLKHDEMFNTESDQMIRRGSHDQILLKAVKHFYKLVFFGVKLLSTSQRSVLVLHASTGWDMLVFQILFYLKIKSACSTSFVQQDAQLFMSRWPFFSGWTFSESMPSCFGQKFLPITSGVCHNGTSAPTLQSEKPRTLMTLSFTQRPEI